MNEERDSLLPVYPSEREGSRSDQNVANIPAIGQDELPPLLEGSMIRCEVCHSMINAEGKTHKLVVKCDVCNEVTRIQTAPASMKFVRCLCNRLLICEVSSKYIRCTRSSCNRVINMTEADLSALLTQAVGKDRFRCAHCNEIFIFDKMNRALPRCPHCRKVSSVGQHARRKSIRFFIAFFLMLAIAIAVTITTLNLERQSNGFIALYVALFLVGLLCLIGAIYYAAMLESHKEGEM